MRHQWVCSIAHVHPGTVQRPPDLPVTGSLLVAELKDEKVYPDAAGAYFTQLMSLASMRQHLQQVHSLRRGMLHSPRLFLGSPVLRLHWAAARGYQGSKAGAMAPLLHQHGSGGVGLPSAFVDPKIFNTDHTPLGRMPDLIFRTESFQVGPLRRLVVTLLVFGSQDNGPWLLLRVDVGRQLAGVDSRSLEVARTRS